MSKFLPKGKFKWIDPKEFESNKYSSNSSKVCVLEVDFNILKNYSNPLAPEKMEIKKEMSNYQLKIADFYIISIVNVKKRCLRKVSASL